MKGIQVSLNEGPHFFQRIEIPVSKNIKKKIAKREERVNDFLKQFLANVLV